MVIDHRKRKTKENIFSTSSFVPNSTYLSASVDVSHIQKNQRQKEEEKKNVIWPTLKATNEEDVRENEN